MKYAFLDTESTTVMTISQPADSRSSTTKSTLSIFQHALGTGRGYNSLTRECFVDLVRKHRSQVLIYWPIYLDIWGYQ